MSEDRNRGTSSVPVRPGNVGRADPNADPDTNPSLRAVVVDPSGGPTVPVAADPSGGPTLPVATDPSGGPTQPVATDPAARPHAAPAVARTRMSGLWAGLILSALVLLLLLIFILQNLSAVTIHFLGATGTLPIGVALLLAAIGGLLLVAIPGSLRIIQLRRAARRRSDAVR